ncbi:extracellular solute-binding protein [Paenibacillus hemerocallicola]|uniref:Extracellular solute-binding protein n=1 Tax=Paenibacillus hemerocallicola TaxID=1172614 RepID=A0A5C4T5F1_9BACL|nr:extracellular solute-binding protein [Paenibacillus hemerocallicola]
MLNWKKSIKKPRYNNHEGKERGSPLRFVPLFALASVIFLFSLAGCRPDDRENVQEWKPMEEHTQVSLKIMYPSEERFYVKYGNLFMSKYPNVNVEVASMEKVYSTSNNQTAAMEEFINKEQPDVLYLWNMDQYIRYAAEGRLYALDTIIRQDRFDLTALAPAVIELLRSKGEGRLYGLGNSYYALALFYNKDLFDQYGAPYPKDRMSWDKAYDLARKFSAGSDKNSGIYGLQFKNGTHPYYFVQSIGGGQRLEIIDPDLKKVQVAAEAWDKIIRKTSDEYKTGSLYLDSDSLHDKPVFSDPRKRDPFISGKTAMAIDDPSLLAILKEKETRKETMFDWDLVTVPVDPKHSDTGSDFMITDLFAINSRSSQLRPAWEFIKYIHDDEYSKIKSRTERGLMTRVKYSNEKYGRNLEAFYTLKPADTLLQIGYSQIPFDVQHEFAIIAVSEIGAIFSGEKTSKEAIRTLQVKGQELLDNAIYTE